MIVRMLDTQAAKMIYRTHLKKDFAPDEVKPFSAIKAMLDRGEYLVFGFYENDELSAYAYFVTPKGLDAALLDYFAVVEGKREAGLGSRCVARFSELLGGKMLVLETEHPDFYKDDKDRNTRLRRIAFYEKNGLRMSGVHTRLYGVDFKIMSLSTCQVTDTLIHKTITDIYTCMFPNLVMKSPLVKIFDLKG